MVEGQWLDLNNEYKEINKYYLTELYKHNSFSTKPHIYVRGGQVASQIKAIS
ncbi:hypothetical protein SAE01_47130 [Segetibacter aerophilus]|uniref:Uncharacterized protein n=1 Tax=Segetibacter aerophilus TaxID=670293 RepID=A0A512BK67_9BACT|nr:hypothetical protein SAE01_47130 [Segetibacter aerophilus]